MRASCTVRCLTTSDAVRDTRDMKHTWLFTLAVVSISGIQLACGSSDDGAGGAAGASGSAGNAQGSAGKSGGTSNDGFPAVALDADIRTMTESDKGLLCDWINATLGGYGVATPCGNGSVSNDRDQAQCLATRFRYQCKVTPAQVRACTLDEAPDHACTIDFPSCSPLVCQ